MAVILQGLCRFVSHIFVRTDISKFFRLGIYTGCSVGRCPDRTGPGQWTRIVSSCCEAVYLPNSFWSPRLHNSRGVSLQVELLRFIRNGLPGLVFEHSTRFDCEDRSTQVRYPTRFRPKRVFMGWLDYFFSKIWANAKLSASKHETKKWLFWYKCLCVRWFWY